ncbi:PLD nuclease N-terminal domain-containing protein [Sporichthya polymorpha]|uniref:PLD nuclease N-terminal domain-containing protein n=1 Tax=Sporichthya polymorpha TaxID=35751 RepID=UPI00037D9CBD|nr:PLD nuclease N-terminal domain-containing protein [Sporichthya polymorpha]
MRVPITLIVLTVMIVVWALVEVVQADKAQIRRLPKWAWLVLCVFPLPPTGAIAWFFLGRPKAGVAGVGNAGSLNLPNLPRRTRYVSRPAPDDDPDFLRRLNEEAERQRMLRRLEDDLKSPNPSEPNDKPGESAPRD